MISRSSAAPSRESARMARTATCRSDRAPRGAARRARSPRARGGARAAPGSPATGRPAHEDQRRLMTSTSAARTSGGEADRSSRRAITSGSAPSPMVGERAPRRLGEGVLGERAHGGVDQARRARGGGEGGAPSRAAGWRRLRGRRAARRRPGVCPRSGLPSVSAAATLATLARRRGGRARGGPDRRRSARAPARHAGERARAPSGLAGERGRRERARDRKVGSSTSGARRSQGWTPRARSGLRGAVRAHHAIAIVEPREEDALGSIAGQLAELRDGLDRAPPHVVVGIVERGPERVDRRRVTALAEDLHVDQLAAVGVEPLEGGGERRRRRGARVGQHVDGRVAEADVVAVGQRVPRAPRRAPGPRRNARAAMVALLRTRQPSSPSACISSGAWPRRRTCRRAPRSPGAAPPRPPNRAPPRWSPPPSSRPPRSPPRPSSASTISRKRMVSSTKTSLPSCFATPLMPRMSRLPPTSGVGRMSSLGAPKTSVTEVDDEPYLRAS